MERVRLDLEAAEYRGLVRLSERELRPVADQIRFLVSEALTREGLLNECQAASTPEIGQAVGATG